MTRERSSPKSTVRPPVRSPLWPTFKKIIQTVVLIVWLAVTSAAVAAAQDTPTATLIEQSPWANKSTPFHVTATTTTDAVFGRLALHTSVTSRSAFAETLSDNPELGRVVVRTESAPMTTGSGASSNTRKIQLRLDLNTIGVSLRPGVHPIEIEFLDDSNEIVDRLLTHFVQAPDPSLVEQPLSVSIIVPIAAVDPIRPERPIGIDRTEVDRLASLVGVLDAHRDVTVVLAPDPRTIHALSEGDDDALTVLDQVKGLAQGSTTVAQPFTDIDPRAWVAAGHAPEIAAQLDTGSAQVSGAMLTEIGRDWWIGTDPLDKDVVDVFHEAGVRYVTAPSSNFVPLDENEFPITLVEPFIVSGREHDLIAIALDEALVAATATSSNPALAAQRLVTDLSVLYFDRPNVARGTVLMPADPYGWDPSQLDRLLAALAGHPLIRAVDLDTLAASIEPARSADTNAVEGDVLTRAFAPASSADLSTFPEDLLALRARVDTYGSIIGPNRPELLPLRVRSLAASSQQLRATERQRFIDHVDETIALDLADTIELPIEQQITLTARDGVIPLTIRSNQPDRTLHVLVRLASDKLSFPSDSQTSIAIGGVDHTDVIRLNIPVKALSSGAFPLHIEVTSPNGALVLADTEVTVRSTAISGVGLVLSIGAGLFLLLWWARNFRLQRRNSVRK